MQVIHTIATLAPSTGGPARSVPALAVALRAQGLDITIWAAAPQKQDWCRPLQDAGVRVGWGAFDTTMPANLMHDHGIWLRSNHSSATVARHVGLPRVVSPRGMLEPWALAHKRLKKRVAWWLYQQRDLQTAALLHATAESEAVQFRKLGLNIPIVVVPNGVDVPELNSPRHPAAGGEKTATFIGRIHPKKGLSMWIEAWKKVRPEHWKMQVIGPDEGGHRAQLEKQVIDAGLQSSWTFRPAIDGPEKLEVLRRSELFVLPTYSENFGIAVAEALAAGLPVITTEGAPWGGLLEHRAGWWVAPDPDSLATALREATATSPEVLVEMGERGRRWMKSSFSWREVATKMIAGYERVLSSA